jgi:hypothetical protein
MNADEILKKSIGTIYSPEESAKLFSQDFGALKIMKKT